MDPPHPGCQAALCRGRSHLHHKPSSATLLGSVRYAHSRILFPLHSMQLQQMTIPLYHHVKHVASSLHSYTLQRRPLQACLIDQPEASFNLIFPSFSVLVAPFKITLHYCPVKFVEPHSFQAHQYLPRSLIQPHLHVLHHQPLAYSSQLIKQYPKQTKESSFLFGRVVTRSSTNV